MFRCAAIGDTRVWLDCFYGAAQPMRAALRLPPAPAAQTLLSQNPTVGASPADPDLRYRVTTDVIDCNGLGEDREWLDCYYAAAQPVRARLGLPPAPQVRPQLPVQSRGSLTSFRSEPATVARFPLSSRMSAYRFDGHGFFTVDLANGQTWRQLPGDTSMARWGKPASSYTVRISRGALHSFNLKVDGIGQEYKVEQAK
jgi:hypothetical protein